MSAEPSSSYNWRVKASGAEIGPQGSLFQVNGAGLEDRFAIVAPYSHVEMSYNIQNCTNISLVLLGIIENPEKYLETCTSRYMGTSVTETGYILEQALGNAGIPFGKKLEFVSIDVSDPATFGTKLWEIGKQLRDDFATPLDIIWDNNKRHTVILKKIINFWKGEVLLFIDGQVMDENGEYPLLQMIPESEKETIFQSPTYARQIVKLIAYLGPIVPEEKLSLLKFDPTQRGQKGILMNTSAYGFGGHRKVSRRKRKHKKTRKAKHSSR